MEVNETAGIEVFFGDSLGEKEKLETCIWFIESASEYLYKSAKGRENFIEDFLHTITSIEHFKEDPENSEDYN